MVSIDASSVVKAASFCDWAESSASIEVNSLSRADWVTWRVSRLAATACLADSSESVATRDVDLLRDSNVV